jgi:4'-phosphopantetheinyl transferase
LRRTQRLSSRRQAIFHERTQTYDFVQEKTVRTRRPVPATLRQNGHRVQISRSPVETSSGSYRVRYGEAHIWYGRSDSNAFDGLAVLSQEERDRCDRLTRITQRARFAGARAALRRVLACYLGVEPEAIVLVRPPCAYCGSTEHGPPSIASPATTLRYSLSRSEDWWLLGISDACAIGVDVERAAPIDVAQVAAMTLSPAEQRFMRSEATARRQRDVFFRCWTRKEALLKATGTGIVAEMHAVDVRPDVTPAVVVRHESALSGCDWRIEDVSLPGDVFAAVARPAEHASGELTVFRLGPPS